MKRAKQDGDGERVTETAERRSRPNEASKSNGGTDAVAKLHRAAGNQAVKSALRDGPGENARDRGRQTCQQSQPSDARSDSGDGRRTPLAADALCTKCCRRFRAGKPLYCSDCEQSLDQTAGSAASQSLDGEPIQPTLTVGSSNDRSEREADRMAERVLRASGPAPVVASERTATTGRSQRAAPVARRSAPAKPATRQQGASEGPLRDCSDCEPQVQRSGHSGAAVEGQPDRQADGRTELQVDGRAERQVDAQTERQIASARNGGQRLPESTRSFFEPRFGTDFGDVRVQTGAAADRAARAVDAEAFAIGRDVIFCSGAYDPDSHAGRELLAHELTHVLQGSAKIRRQSDGDDASCTTGKTEGQGVHGQSYYYIWGTWERGDSYQSFLRRTVANWVDWYFRGESGEDVQTVVDLVSSMRLGVQIENPKPSCQYNIRLAYTTIEEAKQVYRSGDEEREEDEEEAEETGSALGVERPSAERMEDRTSALRGNRKVLAENPALAQKYLEFMEHFTGLELDGELAAVDVETGLDVSELETIIDENLLRATLTDLFTQGYAEFKDAGGGASLDQFEALEMTIQQQYVRGNPTATHNKLAIGRGTDPSGNEVLGIVHRETGRLYYTERGRPIPDPRGPGMRDRGYQGSPPSEGGLEISPLRESAPGLYSVLNSLRQTVGDPMEMAAKAVEVYWENVERVHARIMDGLGNRVWTAFKEQLPYLVGFLAGHGLASWLIKAAHPVFVSAGVALRGMLEAAGYLMELDFAGQAMEYLHDAAYYLSRIEETESGDLTTLSKSHLEKAAKPIRRLIAEMASDALVGGLTRGVSAGRAIAAARDGTARPTVECSDCGLTLDEGDVERISEGVEPSREGAGPREGKPSPLALEDVVHESIQEVQANKDEWLPSPQYGSKLHTAVEQRLSEKDVDTSGWTIDSEQQLKKIVDMEPAKQNSTVREYLDATYAGWKNSELGALEKSVLDSTIGDLKPDLIVKLPDGQLLIWDLTSQQRETHIAKTMFYNLLVSREVEGRALSKISESYWRSPERMMEKSGLTKAQREVYRLYEAGNSFDEIESETGFSRTEIFQILGLVREAGSD